MWTRAGEGAWRCSLDYLLLLLTGREGGFKDKQSLVAVERVFKTAEWVHLLDKMAASPEADIRKIKPGHKRVAVGESCTRGKGAYFSESSRYVQNIGGGASLLIRELIPGDGEEEGVS